MKKCILFMIFCLFMCELVAAEEANSPLWISIVGVDGILVPIGTYSNGTWLNTWPEPSIDDEPAVEKLIKAKNGKMLIQDIPNVWLGKSKKMPKKWYLWSRKTEPSNISVINAEKYWSHCSSGWALKTNLRPGKVEKASPTPKLGIATNALSGVIPIVIIGKKSKDALSIFPAIKAKFVEKEQGAINVDIKTENGKYLEYTGHPVASIERNKNKIKIEAIYKTEHEVNGNNLYFVVAQRKYRKMKNEQDADCESETLLNSWLIIKNNKASFLDSEIILTDCYGKAMHSIVPDIVLSLRGKHYVVSENYGYEWESYTIHEIQDTKIKKILEVGGGGC
jgi:hypothetical protein